tara:strand:+ start:333 stop:482 length:150 start_codon:yes stop_codon:yes gene_type:complete
VLRYSYWTNRWNNDLDSDEVEYGSTLQLHEDGTLELERIGEDESQDEGV